MPGERIQKSRVPKDVPDLGNPDRKRVLNVLAQRRYRHRRREKIAALEAQTKGLEALVNHQPTNTGDVSPETTSASKDSDTIEELIDVSCGNGSTTYDIHEMHFDVDLTQDFNVRSWNLPSQDLGESCLPDFANPPTPLPLTPGTVELQQRLSSNSTNFPLTADGNILTIPVLGAIHAFIAIAGVLNITDSLWDPTYLHVMSTSVSHQASLPANLRPVTAQLVIPHHPALDLLPWPSMREKLICMLAMPSKLRPPIAREDDRVGSDMSGIWLPLKEPSSSSPGTPEGQSKAIVQLIQDFEDVKDGVRVHRNTTAWEQGNEFVEEAWEVGEVFYRKWWWCLDQKIIEQSNKRRRERGQERLRIAA